MVITENLTMTWMCKECGHDQHKDAQQYRCDFCGADCLCAGCNLSHREDGQHREQVSWSYHDNIFNN